MKPYHRTYNPTPIVFPDLSNDSSLWTVKATVAMVLSYVYEWFIHEPENVPEVNWNLTSIK